MKINCDQHTIGFLSLGHTTELGYFGGLLVLNLLGRPIEFHCTAPIQPNRSQSILYGQSLRPYLLNQTIGPALIGKLYQRPRMLVVIDPAAWPLSEQVGLPLVLIDTDATATASSSGLPADPMSDSSTRWTRLELASQPVRVIDRDRQAQETLLAALQPLAERLPLGEPFERIEGALAEAHALAGSRAGDSVAA